MGVRPGGFLNSSIAPTCVVPAGDSISSHERSSGGIGLVMAYLLSEVQATVDRFPGSLRRPQSTRALGPRYGSRKSLSNETVVIALGPHQQRLVSSPTSVTTAPSPRRHQSARGGRDARIATIIDAAVLWRRLGDTATARSRKGHQWRVGQSSLPAPVMASARLRRPG